MDLNELAQKIEQGNRKAVVELVQKALSEQVSASDILNDGLVKGMASLGEKFKNNEVYVPEVLIAARAMNEGMKILEPILVKDGVKPKGTVVIGTVKGDLHDIGKNLVAMMLKGAGYKVVDIGVDRPAEMFIDESRKNGANIIALSALLTTTMVEMEDVVSKVRASDIKGIRIIIGGAPISQGYSDKILADGYAADAASAVDLCDKLISH